MRHPKRWIVIGQGKIGAAVGMNMAAIAILGWAGASAGAAEELRVGTEVVLRSPDTVLKVGSEVVATGTTHRQYRVEHIQGEWLWVVSGAVRGWVRFDEVDAADQAMEQYDREIAGAPHAAPWAHFQRGNLWLDRKEWARAVNDYSEVLRQTREDDPATLHNRGVAWMGLKDNNSAIADFTAALQLDPKYLFAYENRGRAWAELGSFDYAIADYTAALQLDPADTRALLGRGLAYVETGLSDAAIEDLTEALRLSPNLARAYTGRGAALKAKQEYGRAINDLKAALELTPDDSDAYSILATIRATCPDPRYRDGARAFAAASRAYRLHGGACAHCLDTLAAAYAESTDFKAAVIWQTKALEALPQDDPDRKPFDDRLALYREKKPYHELAPSAADAIATAPAPADRDNGAR